MKFIPSESLCPSSRRTEESREGRAFGAGDGESRGQCFCVGSEEVALFVFFLEKRVEIRVGTEDFEALDFWRRE